MAGWDRNANGDRDVLERIVALLFALAGLADMAAALPSRRRLDVLGFLSYGEAEARAFIMGTAVDVPASADASGEPDAASLASSFRSLALALCAMLAYFALLARQGLDGLRGGLETPAVRASRDAEAAHDTS